MQTGFSTIIANIRRSTFNFGAWSLLLGQWAVLVWCWWPYDAQGQQQGQFVFNHYDMNLGLPSNKINDIAQDAKGFLWLATPEGLVRFDGVRSKVFRKRRGMEHLPFSYVSQLHLDNRGRLWMLTTYAKVGYFNTTTFQYVETPLELEDPTLLNTAKGFIEGTGGQVFIGVAGREILLFDEQAQVFKPAHAYFPRRPGWEVRIFWQEPGTQRYGAILKNGVAIYNRATGAMSYTGHNAEKHPLVDVLGQFSHFAGFLWDKQGRLWFGAAEQNQIKIFCYDLKAGKFLWRGLTLDIPPGQYFELWQLVELSNGTIWAHGAAVFAVFDPTKGRFVTVPSGVRPYEQINYDYIPALVEDTEHNLWVGTEDKGLYRFNPGGTLFRNIGYPNTKSGQPSSGSPLSFLMGPDSSLLVNVWGEGFYRFDKDFKLLPADINGWNDQNTTAAWDVCRDPDGIHAWYACQPGIYKYNMARRTGTFYNPAIFEGKTIRQIAVDPKGNLWFGTQSLGLFKWDAQRGKDDFEKGLYKISEAKINRQVNHIAVDAKGWVWVATAEFGIYVLDSQDDRLVYHFDEKAQGFERIPEAGVSQVLEYSDSVMVLTTSSSVLAFNRTLRQTRELLRDDDIYGLIASVERDREGNLLIGTTSHLYRFHPYKRVFASFNRADGIFDDRFVLSSSYVMPDGRMVFGADRHLVVFDPRALKSSGSMPNVVISGIKRNGVSINTDSLLRLPRVEVAPDANAMTLELSTLRYDHWHAVQYKMEGLDKDWLSSGFNYQAIYTFLPPGTYRFLTRTVDSERNFSTEQVHFTLKVYPPFYQAWWFYCLLGLLGGALLFWFDAERMKRKEAIAQVRNKIADDLHQEVNTALQHINILSEMANIKAGNDPRKSQEYITQIAQKSQNILVAMDDMLWAISPGNDSMEKIAARMREFVGHLNARKQTRIELLVDDSVKRMSFDMKIRYGLFVLFKEMLQGMLSVCPQGFNVHVSLDKKQLCYTVYCDHRDYNETALHNLIHHPDFGRRAEAIHAEWALHPYKLGFVFELKII